MKKWFDELFSKHGNVSASRVMMFFSIILGFILNLIMIYELGADLINISVWGVLFGSLLHIVGVVGYILAKGFETKLNVKIGDKEVKIGNDGMEVTQSNNENLTNNS